MKPDYKIRQEIYHRLTTEFDDDLSTKDVEMSNNVEGNAIRYFTDRNIGWIYPAKSYMLVFVMLDGCQNILVAGLWSILKIQTYCTATIRTLYSTARTQEHTTEY